MMDFSYKLTGMAFGAAIVILQAPQMATALTINEIENIAREITVLIYPPGETGSGIIIGREGNKYYVLTALHVVEFIGGNDEADLKTYDGENHSINVTNIQKLPNNIDLAVLEFTSDRNYRIATLSNFNYQVYRDREYPSADYNRGQSLQQPEKPYIFLSGWPAEYENGELKWRFNPGILFDNSGTSVSNPLVGSRGYELLYTNLSAPGMSGGPVLDTQGRVIGVHGRADGKKITSDNEIVGQFLEEEGKYTVRIKFGLSLGIPIQTFTQWANGTSLKSKLRVENSPPPVISNSQTQSWEPTIEVEDQNNPLYWLDRGNQLWRVNRNQEAIAAFDRAIEIKPNYPLAYFAKGFALGFARQYGEALDACNQAVRILEVERVRDKGDLYYETLRCRAGALQELQRFDGALTALNKAIDNYPENVSENSGDWATKGELLAALQQYQSGIDAINRAIQIRQSQGLASSSVLVHNRGFILLLMERFQDALNDFDRALDINPNYASAWSNKGLVLSDLNRQNEAIAAFDRALDINPNDVNTWNNRGIILYQLGRKNDALSSFERAIEIDNNYQPAIENRAILREELGR